MAFPAELLAEALKAFNPIQPSVHSQGLLRRAVSTAYYALFHLLIAETVSNWTRPEQRERLSRIFEHKQMKIASDRVSGRPYSGVAPDIVDRLRQVAECFVDLQRGRIEADYDRGKSWTTFKALSKVQKAKEAFDNVDIIRSEQIFQDYLLSLFVDDRDE